LDKIIWTLPGYTGCSSPSGKTLKWKWRYLYQWV